jgi:DOPA 4,5-dioxygenase
MWLGTPQPLDIDFLRSLPAAAAARSESQPALLTQDSCND